MISTKIAEPRSEATAFLESTPWSNASTRALAGDASARRYFRLTDNYGQTAILMDAPPDLCGSQTAFVSIDGHLRSIGLGAPLIKKANLETGFILLEDFGDLLFANVARADPSKETELYQLGCDVLIQLRDAPVPEVPVSSPDTMTEMVLVVFNHYCADHRPAVGEIEQFQTSFKSCLSQALGGKSVLSLRDYHAENLIYRPEQEGLMRAGLLDFQDAFLTSPAYDLVSFLQDARRDLAPGLEEEMLARYIDMAGEDADQFRFSYAVIGVQRHLRVLGVLARLSREQEKTSYLQYIPRTWYHLQRMLRHPGLAPVASFLSALPEPDTEWLERLKP